MIFEPDTFGSAIVCGLIKPISLEDIVKRKFKIKNLHVSDGKLYNSLNGKMLVDGSYYFRERKNNHASYPDGLISKCYANSKFTVKYSEMYNFVLKGTICNSCKILGPNVHSNDCNYPNKYSLSITLRGLIVYIGDKKINIFKKDKNGDIVYDLNILNDYLVSENLPIITSTNMDTNTNILYKDLFEVKKDKKYNTSAIMLTYHNGSTGDSLNSSNNSNISDNSVSVNNSIDRNNSKYLLDPHVSVKYSDSSSNISDYIGTRDNRNTSVKITIPDSTVSKVTQKELSITILAQRWDRPNFHMNVIDELRSYIDVDYIQTYITSINITNKETTYNFNELFDQINNLKLGEDIKIPISYDSVYVDDTEDQANLDYDDNYSENYSKNVLVVNEDIYFYIRRTSQKNKSNAYSIHTYSDSNRNLGLNYKNINLTLLPFKFVITYYDTNKYTTVLSFNKLSTGTQKNYRYNKTNINSINYIMERLSGMVESYAKMANLTIKSVLSYEDPSDSFKNVILGHIPPKMRKLTKQNSLAKDVLNSEVNLYSVKKKEFSNDIYIIKGKDPSNILNVLIVPIDLDDPNSDNLTPTPHWLSVPETYVRTNKKIDQTICRNMSDNNCRPFPYSFRGNCPEGIIQTIDQEGIQSSYDARFYPCCKISSYAESYNFLLNGHDKNTRDKYLIPDKYRNTENFENIIDNYTGTLDYNLLKIDRNTGNTIVIKNIFRNKQNKHLKYIVVKFIGYEGKSKRKDEPLKYLVEYNTDQRSITALDLHPMYREIRYFRGLNKILHTDRQKNKFLISYFENVDLNTKIFYKMTESLNVQSYKTYVLNGLKNRSNVITRKNLTLLCEPERFLIDVIPKGSVYAEILKLFNNYYLIDEYGRCKIIKYDLGNNISYRGFLNIGYYDKRTVNNVGDSSENTNKKSNTDTISRGYNWSKSVRTDYQYYFGTLGLYQINYKRKVIFYSLDTDIYKHHSELKNLFNIEYLNMSYRSLAKYLFNQYIHYGKITSKFTDQEIIIYNKNKAYTIKQSKVKTVILKVIGRKVENRKYIYILGYENNEPILDNYCSTFNDSSVKPNKFNIGDYVSVKINCVNGQLKKDVYIDMKESTYEKYSDQKLLKEYIDALLYSVDYEMFSDIQWNYSDHILSMVKDITMIDNGLQYNMLKIKD